MRLAATFAVWLLVAGCGAPALTEADYSDLVAKRSAAYAAEAEELAVGVVAVDETVAIAVEAVVAVAFTHALGQTE